ncbi:hypothetical protein B7767_29965 [Streptomyces sp. 13-12-16]|nr:hypothetical protein B7767_29965 [Streptomyces sp. 13-12-16]
MVVDVPERIAVRPDPADPTGVRLHTRMPVTPAWPARYVIPAAPSTPTKQAATWSPPHNCGHPCLPQCLKGLGGTPQTPGSAPHPRPATAPDSIPRGAAQAAPPGTHPCRRSTPDTSGAS